MNLKEFVELNEAPRDEVKVGGKVDKNGDTTTIRGGQYNRKRAMRNQEDKPVKEFNVSLEDDPATGGEGVRSKTRGNPAVVGGNLIDNFEVTVVAKKLIANALSGEEKGNLTAKLGRDNSKAKFIFEKAKEIIGAAILNDPSKNFKANKKNENLEAFSRMFPSVTSLDNLFDAMKTLKPSLRKKIEDKVISQ